MRIATHLTTHANRYVMLIGYRECHFDHTDHGRIGTRVQIGHILIAAINRQAVLDEVIGADAEKVDLFDKTVHHQDGRWHLHHHAYLDIPVESNPRLFQILHRVSQHHFSLP